MSLFFASLNSGSNANCYFVGDAKNAVLIDAGLSCKETLKRLQQMKLQTSTIRAIFISHEHTDHIKGVEVLSRKLQIPVFISEATQSNSRLFFEPHLIKRISSGSTTAFGSISVESFTKHHDAADPFSFTVSSHNVTVGVFTDLGHACSNVVSAFSKCQAAILEANYDDTMLDNGPYPYYLKQRIKSEKGHLSNAQALDLFLKHKSEHLKHVMLGHLSKENNAPDLVHRLFSAHAGNTAVHVASRYEASPVFMLQQIELGYSVIERNLQPQLFA